MTCWTGPAGEFRRTSHTPARRPDSAPGYATTSRRARYIAADGDDLTASFPGRPADHGDHWLEPNVVNVNGRIRVFVRLRIDRQTTAHLCAVCDVADDGEELELRFTQLHPLPGNCYFHIIRDEPVAAHSRTDGARCGAAVGSQHGYFWAVTSLPTRTQDLEWGREMAARGLLKGRAGNERRFLMLMYSLDALNWFPAGCIAMWPSPGQGFQYNALLVDGDDLAGLVAHREERGQSARQRPRDHSPRPRLPLAGTEPPSGSLI